MNKQLIEIKEALSKATPGPWKINPCDDDEIIFRQKVICKNWSGHQDAHLIANAPQWLASLVSQVEEMERTWLSPDTARALMDDMKELRGSHMKNEQLEKQVEEMQKTIETAFNIACEEFETVNQLELVRATLGATLQSLKGDKP